MGWARKTAKKVSKDLAKFDDKIIQPVIKTVEKVVEDPKLLAAVAISVLAPGVGTAIGSALGLGSGVAATVVGNTIVNTALNGGDVKKALVSAVIPVAGAEVAKVATTAFVDLGLSDALAKSVGTATAKAVVAEVTGQDAKTAFIGSVAGSAVNAATSSVEAFKDLPKPIQQAVNSGITAGITGGDSEKAVTSSLVNSGLGYLKSELAGGSPAKEPAAQVANNDVKEPDVVVPPPVVDNTVKEPDAGLPQIIADNTAKQPEPPAPQQGIAAQPAPIQAAADQDMGISTLAPVAPAVEKAVATPIDMGEDIKRIPIFEDAKLAAVEPEKAEPAKVEPVATDVKKDTWLADSPETEEELFARLPPELVKHWEWLKNNPGPYSQVLPPDPLEPVAPPEAAEPAPVEPDQPSRPAIEAAEPGPIAPADVGQSQVNEGVDLSLYPVQNFGVPVEQYMDSYQKTLQDIYDNGGMASQWMPNGDGTNTMVHDDGSTVTINENNEIVYVTPATDTAPATTPAPTTPKPTTTTPGTTTTPTSSTGINIGQNMINAAAAGLLSAGAASALNSLTSGSPEQQAVARKIFKMDWNQQDVQSPEGGIAYGQQYLNPQFTEVKAAQGGLMSLAGGGMLGSYSDGGRLLRGPGDGMSDNIPASISNKQPARLADGEFVVPADVVSHLGNGSTEAGSRVLYEMMNRVRKARTGNPKQGKQINATKFMPK